jgi:sulfite exporter TauE/SafE
MTTYVLLFTAGLASSLHCVGMCGPFAVAIAGERRERTWVRSALYNAARVNTLTIVGAFCGAAGAVVVAAGPLHGAERLLALIAGTLMLVVGLETLGLLTGISGRLIYPVQRGIGRMLGGTMRSQSLAAPIALGVFNAFLPCHLIYAFAARAAGTGSIGDGALTMLAFGLGTVPAMLTVGAVRRWLPGGAAARLSMLSGALVLGFAVLTLSRAFAPLATCPDHP